MKVDLLGVGGGLVELAWVALRSFLGTLLVFTAAGIVLACVSYYFLHEGHGLYGVIAATVALLESVATGVVLGGKRAMAMAVAHGLAMLRLGRILVRLVFERMLGVAEGDAFGMRGGRVARRLERLPLAKAEELLSSAVRDLTGDDAARGSWLRRKIQARLLEAVRKYTLTRFRQESAEHGGIDLVKVQEELEQGVDAALVCKVSRGLRVATSLAILGLPFVVAVQSWIVVLFLRSG